MYLNTDLNLTSKRLWKSLYCANADVFFPSASHFNIVRDLTKMGKACQHSCNVSLTTKCFSLQHRARHCKQKYFRKWLRKQHPAVCLPLSEEGWCGVDCLTLEGRLLDLLWLIDYLDLFSSHIFRESDWNELSARSWNGQFIRSLEMADWRHYLVLFAWVPGVRKKEHHNRCAFKTTGCAQSEHNKRHMSNCLDLLHAMMHWLQKY